MKLDPMVKMRHPINYYFLDYVAADLLLLSMRTHLIEIDLWLLVVVVLVVVWMQTVMVEHFGAVRKRRRKKEKKLIFNLPNTSGWLSGTPKCTMMQRKYACGSCNFGFKIKSKYCVSVVVLVENNFVVEAVDLLSDKSVDTAAAVAVSFVNSIHFSAVLLAGIVEAAE